jgi:hypothetical protein
MIAAMTPVHQCEKDRVAWSMNYSVPYGSDELGKLEAANAPLLF